MHPALFPRNQVISMYYLAKERGIPVDSMSFNSFIDYVNKQAPDILVPVYNLTSIYSTDISSADEIEASLLFDGERLYWQQENKSTSWPAYSGTNEIIEEKNYSKEAQKLKNEGPIPEGWYRVPQERYQERPDDLWEKLKNTMALGAWPGGRRSWGDQRVWLEPEDGTETYGRTNMSIHGGDVPGSRGCIDLTHNMEKFSKLFRQYGKSMRLEVKYKTN